MKKPEIIEYLANAGVPEGAQLVECDAPGGLRVSAIDASNAGGLHIMAARFFADDLLDDPALIFRNELEAGFGADLVRAKAFDGIFQGHWLFAFFVLCLGETAER